MPTITKQQVLDRRQALDQVAADARDRKNHDYIKRVAREQVTARRQLVADCDAAAGHVYAPHDIECLFCGAPKDAGQRVLQRNLVKG